MSRRLGKLAAAAALVAVLGLAAAWAARRLGPEPGPFTVTGTIEAIQVDISPRITGRIVERTVREGQAAIASAWRWPACSCTPRA